MAFNHPDANATWFVIICIFLMVGVGILGGTIWQWLIASPAKRPSAEGGRPSSPISPPVTASKPRPSGPLRIQYRTLDGTMDYEFCFVHLSGGWRIYILDQPSYAGWPQDSHATHRHFDKVGPYICWDIPITTLEDAKKITARWAEATERYRKTGKTF